MPKDFTDEELNELVPAARIASVSDEPANRFVEDVIDQFVRLRRNTQDVDLDFEP